MKVRKIGADGGFGYFKVVWFDEEGQMHVLVVPAVLGRAALIQRQDLTTLGGKARQRIFKVTYQGEEYFVGSDALLHSQTGLAATQTFGRIGSDEERILLLAMLAKAGLTNVVIVTGLPVLAWDLRNKLRKSWTGEHEIMLGRKEVAINIREVRTAWQPVLSLYDHALTVEVSRETGELEVKLALGMDSDKLRRGWLVVDVGYNTTDRAGVIGLTPVDQYSGGARVGGRDILAVIDKAIQREYGVSRPLAEIEQALRRGWIDIYEDRVELLPMAQSAAGSLSAQVASNVADGTGDGSQFYAILITGGPAEIVKPAIAEAFPRNQVIVLRDSQIANARGAAKWAQGPKVFKCLR